MENDTKPSPIAALATFVEGGVQLSRASLQDRARSEADTSKRKGLAGGTAGRRGNGNPVGAASRRTRHDGVKRTLCEVTQLATRRLGAISAAARR